jgi:formate hydrogenlyase subunit 3/multisubunit Na+/H+ antiporter MnhD subunit
MTVGLAVAAGLPLVLALLLAPTRTRGPARGLAGFAALPALLVAAIAPGSELELSALVLGTRFALDGESRVFLALTAALWLAAGLFGTRYLARDERRAGYTAFFLAAMAGNLGVCVVQDLAGFYVCFALMSFASYGLVVHDRSADAFRAGRIYLILVLVGEVALFTGLVLVAAQTPGDGLAASGPQRAPASGWALPLLLLGFGIKAGALPLHVWLPLAHPVAPTPASAVLSGAMIKAGLIGWLRFLPLGDPAASGWAEGCLVMGLVAALYGAAVGLGQRDAKTVLAYSSISQMGLVTIAFGAALADPVATPAALGYAVHHGLAKSALFLGVAVAAAARGRGGRGLAAAGLLLPALALAGAPTTSGAAAKLALKQALGTSPLDGAAGVTALLPVAALGTTLLMARFLVLAWPRGEGRGIGALSCLPWLALLAGVASAPVWLPGWGGGLARTFAPASLPAALWPLLAGVVAAVLVGRGGRAGRAVGRLPSPPAGDLVVGLEAIATRWADRRYTPASSAWWLARQQTLARAIARMAPGDRLVRSDLALTRGAAVGSAIVSLVVGLAVALAMG